MSTIEEHLKLLRDVGTGMYKVAPPTPIIINGFEWIRVIKND